MNSSIRVIIAVVLIAIIMFSSVTIAQHLFKGVRLDITEQKLYTLSDGTKNILAKLVQPVTLKLYYSKTGANKGPDQIRYYNEYYFFVRSLLEEYEKQSGGKVELEVIDPRPFSDEEADAMRQGLQRLQITQDESFFFGLVLETELGVTKIIEFFQPQRQQFVEYDISYLIDTAITREKKRIGVISSLPVLGDDLTPYMRQMMQMQNQQAQEPWILIQQLREKYEVNQIPEDAHEITDTDLLLAIHPKELAETTLFAIDQFVLQGGRTIVFVDPHCFDDAPPAAAQQNMQMMMQHDMASSLKGLLRQWGLEVPELTFAGDRALAQLTQLRQGTQPERFIGMMQFDRQGMNETSPISSQLNELRMLFPGVIRPIADVDTEAIELTPLVQTTNRGNAWSVDSAFELKMGLDAARLMQRFSDGDKPVAVGYLSTGRFTTAYPDGITVETDEAAEEPLSDGEEEATEETPKTERITGLTQTAEGEDSVVLVVSDVDFLSDRMAYSRGFLGMVSVANDNSALVLNAIEDLSGSADLLSIRSRGSYQRPFEVIDEIEAQAEKETADQIAQINAEIQGFQQELQQISGKVREDNQDLIGAEVLSKKKELELKIHEANRRLRQVQQSRRESIEAKEDQIMWVNLAAAPGFVLIVAVLVGLRQTVRKRYYVSHPKE